MTFNLTLPPSGAIPSSVNALCTKSGVNCIGLPPHSCAVFGPDARLSFDPHRIGDCLSCAGANRGALAAVLVLCIISIVALGGLYLRAVAQAKDEDFKGWIANVSILLEYSSVVLLLISALVIEIAAPLALRIFSFLRFIYLDLGGAQLECLLPQGQGHLPYVIVGLAVGVPVVLTVLLALSSLFIEGAARLSITIFAMSFPSLISVGLAINATGDSALKMVGGLLITYEVLGALALLLFVNDESHAEVLSYITQKYRDQVRGWQFVEWVRQLLSSIVLTTNNTKPLTQAGWMIAFEVIFALVLLWKHPYASPYQNITAVLMAISIVICFSIASHSAATYVHCFDGSGHLLQAVHQHSPIKEAMKETSVADSLCTLEDIRDLLLNNATTAPPESFVGTPSQVRTGAWIVVLLLLPAVGMPWMAFYFKDETAKKLIEFAGIEL